MSRHVHVSEVHDVKPATEVSTSPRLMSLDALRGFDMFWIVGAEAIVHALHKVSEAGPIGLLARQLTHKKWQGLAFYDLIFPLFVFIVGVSLVFSLTRSIEQHGRAATFRRIVRRSVLLYLIGIIYYGGIADGVAHIRLLGVLQRIALAYFFAGLVFMTFRLRGMVLICILLLVVYWGLMTFVPVPGVGAGNFEQGKNLANYIDRHYLPLRKWDGDHDPEGLLSTMPAIATCLLGVFVGLLMKTRQITEQRKVLWLLVAGAAGIALGHLWGLQFPIIKKVWTSSYVLAAPAMVHALRLDRHERDHDLPGRQHR
jgi:predicted acyltransferase